MDDTQTQKAQNEAETQAISAHEGAAAPNTDDRKPITLQEASAIAERLERANAEHRVLVERDEQIRAQKMLGGKTEAGFIAPLKEDTPKEYAQKILHGQIPLK